VKFEPRHIGDGVYVDFDGYHVTLAVNDHRNVVASLEPAVQVELVKVFEEIASGKYGTD
jgi:hypothetical protein